MATGGKRQQGPAHRRQAQGKAKSPAAHQTPGAKGTTSAPKRAAIVANTTESAQATTKGAALGAAGQVASSEQAAAAKRPGATAVATRPAPRPANGAVKRVVTTQPNYRSRMNQRKRVRQQQRRIWGTVAAVLVVAGLGWLLISHLPLHAAGNNGAKAAKSAATAHVTAAATSVPATATALTCAPVSVMGLNGTPSRDGGPPAITGTLVNGPQCLQYVDFKTGSGPAIKAGDTATVNYTLWLSTGQKVQSSLDSGGSPFQVQNIGQASVIAGWNLGLIGMKVGGERRLIVPPSLGYGAGGQPPSIPGDETLIFDISVVSIP